MSAPTVPVQEQSNQTPSTSHSNSGSGQPISPTQAGVAGAALGLGAGLLFAELVIPGAILAVLGLAGLSAFRNGSRK